MTEWQYYPQSRALPDHLVHVIAVFEAATAVIGSKGAKLTSNQVLAAISGPLSEVGYLVETGSSRAQKVRVPVLFGRNGRVGKAFEVDAWSAASGTVIEVEAGRALVNNQFLKDLFEACVMPSVNFLVIGVRSDYRGQNNFEQMCAFLDTLYVSDRLTLPLTGVLAVGY